MRAWIPRVAEASRSRVNQASNVSVVRSVRILAAQSKVQVGARLPTLRSMKIEPTRTSYRSPWQNGLSHPAARMSLAPLHHLGTRSHPGPGGLNIGGAQGMRPRVQVSSGAEPPCADEGK
jgi:hypothetical protein